MDYTARRGVGKAGGGEPLRAWAVAFFWLIASAAGSIAADEDRAAMRARLFDALAAARTEAEANLIAADIWDMWFTPPGYEVANMVELASHLRIIGNYKASLEVWDRIVAIAPEWPEGWNQRATLHYRMGHYDASLADIAETLAREPKHFGALAGRAEIERLQGRLDDSERTLQEAAGIHPWIVGRPLVDPGPGVDL
jgi:tetratricopeptide (TPR) repeat protein